MPTGHGVQRKAPGAALYDPGVHAVHVEPATALAFPIGQSVHASDPTAPGLKPCVPAAQSAQSVTFVAPAPTPYVLSGHGVHEAAPRFALNVPFAHSCGTADAGGQYVPASQSPLHVLLVSPSPPQRPAGQGCAVAETDAGGQK